VLLSGVPRAGVVDNVIRCLYVHAKAYGDRRQNDGPKSGRLLKFLNLTLAAIRMTGGRARVTVYYGRRNVELFFDVMPQQPLDITKFAENDDFFVFFLNDFQLLEQPIQFWRFFSILNRPGFGGGFDF